MTISIEELELAISNDPSAWRDEPWFTQLAILVDADDARVYEILARCRVGDDSMSLLRQRAADLRCDEPVSQTEGDEHAEPRADDDVHRDRDEENDNRQGARRADAGGDDGDDDENDEHDALDGDGEDGRAGLVNDDGLPMGRVHVELNKALHTDPGALSQNGWIERLARLHIDDPLGEWLRCRSVLCDHKFFKAVMPAVERAVAAIRLASAPAPTPTPAEEPREPPPVEERDAFVAAGRYRMSHRGTFREVETRDGETVWKSVANFEAHIRSVIEKDDGTEIFTKIELTIATASGTRAVVSMSEGELVGQEWPGKLVRYGGTIEPRERDHMRAAIQKITEEVHGGPPPLRRIHGRLGWARVDERWIYLHAGGAIDEAGQVAEIEVDVPDPLGVFVLPEPPRGDELRQRIRGALRVLEVADRRVMVVLFGAVWRSIVGGSGITVWLSGASGLRKSTLVALIQSFFCKLISRTWLPGSAGSTGLGNAALLNLAADMLLGIDDHAPDGGSRQQERQASEMTMLVRNVANHAVRHRARRDGTLAPGRAARGLPIVTAENTLQVRSARARTINIELLPGSVDLDRLSAAQEDAFAGRLAEVTAAFVMWLAPRREQVREWYDARAVALRGELSTVEAHGRAYESIGEVVAALDVFLVFAQRSEAITSVEKNTLFSEWRETMREVLVDQALHVAEQETVPACLRMVAAAIAAKRAHVSTFEGKAPDDAHVWGYRAQERDKQDVSWIAGGDHIGWVDRGIVYLDPDPTYRAIVEYAHATGHALQVADPARLGTMLKQASALVPAAKLDKDIVGFEKERTNTVRLKRIKPGRPRAWPITAARLVSGHADDGDDADEDEPDVAGRVDADDDNEDGEPWGKR